MEVGLGFGGLMVEVGLGSGSAVAYVGAFVVGGHQSSMN